MNPLRKVADGNEEALERFYEEHVDGLYAFVFYRVGRDAAIAEDVVQETFLQAIDRVREYDPERGGVRAWLCTLSRNVIKKHVKSAAWDRIDETLQQVFAALDKEPLSDEVIAREETRDLVNMTIANLPDNYRTILEKKYVAGDSMDKLAGDLALSEAAAKSLLARARRAFREAFLTLTEMVS